MTMTLEEAGHRLGLPGGSRRTVRDLIRRHTIPYLRVGKAIRLTEEQFTALQKAITCCDSPSATAPRTTKSPGRLRSTANRSASDAARTQLTALLQLRRQQPSNGRS